MRATQELHDLGQSIWLDNITRALLTSGKLREYIRDFSVTGLTSNPTIFDNAIKAANSYDAAIREKVGAGLSGEDLFYDLALEDLTQAADLFRAVHDATGGVDGWVSLELSPLLADDSDGSVKAAKELFARARRPNLFIKIPGTEAGATAIEESIYAGIPVNVTLLFSRRQYLRAAEAYLRGIERRIEAGLDPRVASVASVFVSRWDVAVQDKVPAELRNKLGVAVGLHTYQAYCELQDSARWKKLRDAGALMQRLLWASTGTKDPKARDTFYVEALAAPDTINTMPEQTLIAFAEHGAVGAALPRDGGEAKKLLAAFAAHGIDEDALAADLQRAGADSFMKSWKSLLGQIEAKSVALAKRAG
ncbi:MAG: transaldolase [Pseudomonadota bacterium]